MESEEEKTKKTIIEWILQQSVTASVSIRKSNSPDDTIGTIMALGCSILEYGVGALLHMRADEEETITYLHNAVEVIVERAKDSADRVKKTLDIDQLAREIEERTYRFKDGDLPTTS